MKVSEESLGSVSPLLHCPVSVWALFASVGSYVSSENVRRAVRLAPWIIIGAVLLVAALPAFYAVAPVGCVTCHKADDRVADVTVEAHAEADANCGTCHIGKGAWQRVRFATIQAYAMTIPLLSTEGGPASIVSDGACSGCHKKLPEVSESVGLRIRHESCAESRMCVDCHSTTAHGQDVQWPKTYHMDMCLDCHDIQNVSADCDTCHTGDLDRTRRPETAGPWSITHGPNWRSTHGLGSMSTCGACHAQGYCTRCHGAGVPHDQRFFDVHGVTSLARDAKCEGCHAQAFCTDCHGTEMPHPKSFTRQHSQIVEERGQESCLACHAESDCNSCHEGHVHPGGAIAGPTVQGGQR